MQNLPYLFAAYTVIWIALFFFLLNLSRRNASLRKDIEALKRAIEAKESEAKKP